MQLQRFIRGDLMPMKPYTTPADIRRLKELTGKFGEDIDTKYFKLENGRESVVRNLMKRDAVGVVDAGIPAGGTFPWHNHETFEWLIVYNGKAEVRIAGEVYLVGPNEAMKYIIIPPGESHEVKAIEAVRLIGVTMPADEGYPGDSRK